jgi:hypothetical protein
MERDADGAHEGAAVAESTIAWERGNLFQPYAEHRPDRQRTTLVGRDPRR